MSGLVYVLDDEVSIRESIIDILSDEDIEAQAFAKYAEMKPALEQRTPDLILLDIWLDNEDGMDILKELKDKHPFMQIVMISGHGSVDLAVNATKMGAFDFLEKPLSLERVITTVNNAIKLGSLERENIDLKKVQLKYDEIVGRSEAIMKIKEVIGQTAKTNARVFIRGENGTGKELVAKAIYLNSNRAAQPFIEVNCAAIPEDLIESELFGYEKGAFTGADSRRIGKFEQAHKGTLFLDEICDMSLSTQAKVLRVLQEQKLTRLGGNEVIEVDVRIISATNIDVEKAISENKFREDLFYRLNVIPIFLPPLSERREDIPDLVLHYLKIVADDNGITPKSIAQEGLQFLKKYDWPGNIRELRNIVERLSIITPGEEIGLGDIHNALAPGTPGDNKGAAIPNIQLDLKAAREQFEKDYITRVLRDESFNISNTAKNLGIERSNLHRKIKALGIDIDREKG